VPTLADQIGDDPMRLALPNPSEPTQASAATVCAGAGRRSGSRAPQGWSGRNCAGMGGCTTALVFTLSALLARVAVPVPRTRVNLLLQSRRAGAAVGGGGPRWCRSPLPARPSRPRPPTLRPRA